MLTSEDDAEVHALRNVVGRSRRSPATPALTARLSANIWPVTAGPERWADGALIRSSRSSTTSPRD